MIRAALILSCLALPAAAQQSCAPRESVVKRLAEGFGEIRQSLGLGSNNTMMELFASPETGTWTITVTTANGVTCLIAAGQAFESLQVALKPGVEG